MAEQRQVGGDEVSRVTDSLATELRAEDGAVKGPDPAEWGERDAELKRTGQWTEPPLDIGEIRYSDFDDYTVDDLREHASDLDVAGRSNMSREDLVAALDERGVGVVKGPGEQWRRDAEGNYVNR